MNRLNQMTKLIVGDLAAFKSRIHTSSSMWLKKVEIKQDERQKTITIEGKPLDSEATFGNKVLRLDKLDNTIFHEHEHKKPCAFCLLEKQNIYVQYTDVLVLRQFLTQDGAILPQRITGLCWRQHKKLLAMTKLAKQAGLIMNLQPRLLDGSMPNTDIRKRPKHLKWNSYFDDYETMKRKNKFI